MRGRHGHLLDHELRVHVDHVHHAVHVGREEDPLAERVVGRVERLAPEKGALKTVRLAVAGAFHTDIMKPADQVVATALAGVVISLYYYFGIVRAIYWSAEVPDLSPIHLSKPIRFSIYGCIAGMLFLGLFPGAMVNLSNEAVRALKF